MIGKERQQRFEMNDMQSKSQKNKMMERVGGGLVRAGDKERKGGAI